MIYKWRHMKLAIKHLSGLNKTFLKSLFTSYEVRKTLFGAEKHSSREKTFQSWNLLFWKVCLNRVKSRENTFQGWKTVFWKVCLHCMKSGNHFSGLKNTFWKSLFKSDEMLGTHFSGLENTFKKISSILLLAVKTSFSVEFWGNQTYKHKVFFTDLQKMHFWASKT